MQQSSPSQNAPEYRRRMVEAPSPIQRWSRRASRRAEERIRRLRAAIAQLEERARPAVGNTSGAPFVATIFGNSVSSFTFSASDLPDLVAAARAELDALVDEGVGESIFLQVDDHQVPHISLVEHTPPGAPGCDCQQKPCEHSTPRSGGFGEHVDAAFARGEPVYDLVLDDRFVLTAPESEVERWCWFLANAMAVSAGRTSHGQHSRPLNRHGVSR